MLIAARWQYEDCDKRENAYPDEGILEEQSFQNPDEILTIKYCYGMPHLHEKIPYQTMFAQLWYFIVYFIC